MQKKELQHISDQDLLAQFYAGGDNRLLGILLQRYTLLLLGVCMKYLKDEEAAKDSVQQIFFTVINELKRTRVHYFKSWLYMIARNYCLMQLRNNRTKNVTYVDENMIEETASLPYKTEQENLFSAVEASLDDLSAEQKTCVTLFYLEKKSYQQISAQTGFNLLQVKSYIQNGKRNLKLLAEKKLREQ